jgi:hypothetical protein
MNYLLALHILIGFSLLTTFIVRYLGVLTKKIDPKNGRNLISVLGISLIASGTALVIVDKAPISGACISSIVIIAVVVMSEFILNTLARKKIKIPIDTNKRR